MREEFEIIKLPEHVKLPTTIVDSFDFAALRAFVYMVGRYK